MIAERDRLIIENFENDLFMGNSRRIDNFLINNHC